MRFILVMMVALLVGAEARADVTGEWVGTGAWYYGEDGVACPAMKISFRESDAKLDRTGGFFDCGIVTLHSDYFSWDRSGGELSFGGAAAGSISERGFAATEPYGDEGITVRTDLVVEEGGTKASYLERWLTAEGEEIYVIRGDLRRR